MHTGRVHGDLPGPAAAVLDLVERIPPGTVMTYGDVAEYLSGLPDVGRLGPRQVGAVMSRWGAAVPWWRVIRADGSPPPGHEDRALARYRAERTPLRPGGRRVDLGAGRWDGADPGQGRAPGPAPDSGGSRTGRGGRR